MTDAVEGRGVPRAETKETKKSPTNAATKAQPKLSVRPRPPERPVTELSPRQLQILQLRAQGFDAGDISTRLGRLDLQIIYEESKKICEQLGFGTNRIQDLHTPTVLKVLEAGLLNPADIKNFVTSPDDLPTRIATLTPEEISILDQLITDGGMSALNSDITAQLGFLEDRINSRLHSIARKLGTRHTNKINKTHMAAVWKVLQRDQAARQTS